MKFLTVGLMVLVLGWQSTSEPLRASHLRENANVYIQPLLKRSAEGPAYAVEVEGLGQNIKLNLEKPTFSVFSPDFKFTELSADDTTGELQFRDATPSREELEAIEQHFFTDPEANAAISLRHIDGAYKLSGRINDMTIVTRGENNHVLSRKTKLDPKFNDYIDLNQTIPKRSSRALTTATPEVFVVWDYDNTQTFKGSRTAILDYLGVFFHAINNRYATSADPKIAFRISGVTITTTRSAQPYIENNKTPGGSGVDINKALSNFSTWLYANNNKNPKYDMGALISGVDFQSKNSSGSYTSGVAGLAYLGTACLNYTQGKIFYGSSVTEDRGGYYDGAFSVAHEFAHNLGAPHDGDSTASNCPWSDGYIMSYEGWGKKSKFYFSPCSLSLMKNYVDSSQGSCTKTNVAGVAAPISSQDVGDRYSMQQLCVKYTNQTQATVNPGDPNDLCKNLVCRYPTPNMPGYISIITLNHPPGDNSVCGNGGKCIDGDCVGQTATG